MDWLLRPLRRVVSRYFQQRFQSDYNYLCVRVKIRRSLWTQKSPSSPIDIAQAAKDLEPRPKDKGALSLYIVGSPQQAERVAFLHVITNNSPETTYYLCAGASCLSQLGEVIQVVPSWDVCHQHPLLNLHHFVVYGLDDPSRLHALAAAILSDGGLQIRGWTKQTLKQLAGGITKKWHIRVFTRELDDWR